MNLSTKTRRTALAGSVVAGVALAGLAALPAGASTSGTFLAKSDLPQGSYAPWTAQAQKSGLPKPMYTCIKGIIPGGKSHSQTFSGDMTAEVREIITVTASKTDAKKLVHSLRAAITNCEAKLADVTSVDRIGRWSTEDGLTLDAVYTAPENSEYNYQLFAVGRDGRAVVVTTFSDMGKKGEAPTSAFTATAKKALRKAF
jgi:hypothetical protein